MEDGNRIASGLQELGLWLRDRIRSGLHTLPKQPAKFWDDIAARMVDAHAPGIAYRLRQIANIPNSGEDWPARVLEQFSRLHLLVEAYGRLAGLSPVLQAEVMAVIRGVPALPDPESDPHIEDRWWVLGCGADLRAPSAAEMDDPIAWLESLTDNADESGQPPIRRERRWLWGEQSGQIVIEPKSAENASIRAVGTAYTGRLRLRRANYAAQGSLAPTSDLGTAWDRVAGYASIAEGLADYGNALSANPWVEAFPMVLHGVIPVQQANKAWWLRADGLIPVASSFEQGWHLLALSGGGPVNVFGEWNGYALSLLSAWSEGRFVGFKV